MDRPQSLFFLMHQGISINLYAVIITAHFIENNGRFSSKWEKFSEPFSDTTHDKEIYLGYMVLNF
jgi:hypothetical protein